jgi:hypothetical protein
MGVGLLDASLYQNSSLGHSGSYPYPPHGNGLHAPSLQPSPSPLVEMALSSSQGLGLLPGQGLLPGLGLGLSGLMPMAQPALPMGLLSASSFLAPPPPAPAPAPAMDPLALCGLLEQYGVLPNNDGAPSGGGGGGSAMMNLMGGLFPPAGGSY